MTESKCSNLPKTCYEFFENLSDGSFPERRSRTLENLHLIDQDWLLDYLIENDLWSFNNVIREEILRRINDK